jgi:hypothetical protein
MRESHSVVIEKISWPLDPVEGKSDVRLHFAVRCAQGCSVEGLKIGVVDEEGALVTEVELTGPDGQKGSIGELLVQAPERPGIYSWRALFSAQVRDEVEHVASDVPLQMTVQRHTVSLSVWDVPSVTFAGAPMFIKVGAKCLSTGCSVAGRRVVIQDDQRRPVTEGTMGGDPFPGTTSLQWVEVKIAVPETEGAFSWEVFFPEGADHKAAHYPLNFVTSRRPDAVATIKVSEAFTNDPIPYAIVLIGRFQGETDAGGLCTIEVPKGTYRLAAGRDGYQTYESTVTIEGETAVAIELNLGPTYADY